MRWWFGATSSGGYYRRRRTRRTCIRRRASPSLPLPCPNRCRAQMQNLGRWCARDAGHTQGHGSHQKWLLVSGALALSGLHPPAGAALSAALIFDARGVTLWQTIQTQNRSITLKSEATELMSGPGLGQGPDTCVGMFSCKLNTYSCVQWYGLRKPTHLTPSA